MSAIFEMPADLAGKVQVDPQVSLEIAIRFGLWQNYEQWLDPKDQLDLWYSTDTLRQHPVRATVKFGSEILIDQVLDQFVTLTTTYQFSDLVRKEQSLIIEFVGLNDLPIRDDTGIFVCGMFEIQHVRFQGVDVAPMLDNTFHGNDIEIQLPVSTPIYPYLVEHQTKILGQVFPLP